MFPTYTIDGITYEQRPLVIGQVEQLVGILQGVEFPAAAGPLEIVRAMGQERLMKACAVVLRVQGTARWWDRDLDALAEAFAWSMDAETAVRIVADFFDCNPLSSLFNALARMNAGITAAAASLVPSPASSSSSAEETLPGGTASGGATP
jgi:hypothetical protein